MKKRELEELINKTKKEILIDLVLNLIITLLMNGLIQ